DDPSVYRDAHEPEQWESWDPVKRFRAYLAARGLWNERLEAEINDKHNAEITRVLDLSDKLGPPPVESIFDDVFEEMPVSLREQRDWLLAQDRVKSPHSH
ncbi:MAG TPA: thiamine pyrophosphate-dependent enzyme, partial [Kofleriaceae bacterium]|nr:thiamine pyrophosphate-dependent enzyme [Kofleriaceae bacterium]